jgi:hypothetical protein
MHTYSQIDGRWRRDGQLLGVGYSGRGVGRNRPFDSTAKMPDRAETETMRNLGPLPAGRWRIGPAFTHPILGPLVMPLLPVEGTETYGRTGFLVHGDSREGNASSGCVVLGHFEREAISRAVEAGDRDLTVVDIVREVAA